MTDGHRQRTVWWYVDNLESMLQVINYLLSFQFAVFVTVVVTVFVSVVIIVVLFVVIVPFHYIIIKFNLIVNLNDVFY